MDQYNIMIELPIGKILISFQDGERQFFKVTDENKIEDLNKKEKEYLMNLFNKKKDGELHLETALEIASDNEDIMKEFVFWQPVIYGVDTIIPEGAKEQFYKNLSTVQISNDILDKNVAGTYMVKKNQIIIVPTSLGKQYEDSGKKDMARLYYSQTAAHEMIHLASTNYSAKEDDYTSGFDDNPGLTEGFAEALSHAATRAAFGTYIPLKDAYVKESLIAKQILMICSNSIPSEAFFTGSGVEPIKRELLQYFDGEKNPEITIDRLFGNIETQYCFSSVEIDSEYKSPIAKLIQDSLMVGFKGRVKKMIDSKQITTREQLEEYANRYKETLLTPENMGVEMETAINKFPGTEKVSQEFDNMIESISEMIQAPVQQCESEEQTQTSKIEHDDR